MSGTIENPKPRQNIPVFIYFTKKTLSVNCFQKQYSKAPAKLRPKPGRWPDGNYVKRCPKKRCPKKRKLFYSSSLQGLLHISQSYFQDIFYLDLGFLCISYTRARKVMFRACLVDTEYFDLASPDSR